MSGRARNGSGTLIQRPNGLWMGQIRVDGIRHTVYGKTKKEATDKLDELRRQALLVGALPQRQTLGVLIDSWLYAAEGAAKPSTLRDHKRFSAPLRAYCGDCPLQKITPVRLQHCYKT